MTSKRPLRFVALTVRPADGARAKLLLVTFAAAMASLVVLFGGSSAFAQAPAPMVAVPGGPPPEAPAGEHCVVNVATDDVLNIRTGPGTEYPVIATMEYAQCGVFMTGACVDDWCPVTDGQSAGWVNGHYIALVSAPVYCVTGVAAGDTLNVRAYPSADSQILIQLDPSQCGIQFLPYVVDDWQKIRVLGVEGWAASRYLTPQ